MSVSRGCWGVYGLSEVSFSACSCESWEALQQSSQTTDLGPPILIRVEFHGMEVEHSLHSASVSVMWRSPSMAGDMDSESSWLIDRLSYRWCLVNLVEWVRWTSAGISLANSVGWFRQYIQ